MRSNEELMRALADGDRTALRELHDLHVAWISGRLLRRCSDRDVVPEAVQDTFVAVWKSAAKWDGRGEPAAWMRGAAAASRTLDDSVRCRRCAIQSLSRAERSASSRTGEVDGRSSLCLSCRAGGLTCSVGESANRL
jgi:predicted RNA polymerase sigma factor